MSKLQEIASKEDKKPELNRMSLRIHEIINELENQNYRLESSLNNIRFDIEPSNIEKNSPKDDYPSFVNILNNQLQRLEFLISKYNTLNKKLNELIGEL